MDSLTTVTYLRVASMSIGSYDYILTLPAEWRLYRRQSSIFHLSLSCVLFILIRYVSIVTIVTSNYGFFSTTFTYQACQKYHSVPPIFQAIQTMISQVIFGVRTFNIAKRDRRIGIALLLLSLFAISTEWIVQLSNRTPVVLKGNCTSVNSTRVMGSWFYYLPVLLYDIAMVILSTVHLLRYNPLSSRVKRLTWVLIYDGIGYFLTFSVSSILNIILYHTGGVRTRSAGVSVGYLVTWIISQRLLIGIQDPDAQRPESVIVVRPPTAQNQVISGIHSQGSKSHIKNIRSIDAEFRPAPRNFNDMELDICAHVECSVALD